MFPLKRAVALATFSGLVPIAFGLAHAETQAQKQSQTFVRMAPLEKITVGPYDNFQGVLTSDGKRLLLTQSSNMATRVQVVDMTSVAVRGHSKNLVSEVFDTRDPVPSPNGLKVAYTTFERNARGQICISFLDGTGKDCLPTGKNGARQPQWLNDTEVAYLESSDDGETENVVSLNTLTREKIVFFSDNVLAFAVHPSGNYLVYIVAASRSGGVPAMRWKELKKGAPSVPIEFELPGMSGFPRFDVSGEFLYFSQFFNDTNSDGTIDGDDNAVPFRVSWVAVRDAKKPVVPEQLISAEYNCSYPSVSQRHLLVTCNFEDSLDIYRMPLAGVVPANWTPAQILSAHAAARTLDERVLLLNTLRFRFPQKFDTALTVERLLSNHVVASEYDAASYYAGVLAKRNLPLAPALETLSTILDVRNRARREKSTLPSPTMIAFVESVRQKVRAMPLNEFSALAEVSFDSVLGNVDAARAQWKNIASGTLASPIAVFVYGDLGKRILGQGSEAEDARYDLERRLALHPALSEEGQVSHALDYMRMLGVRERDPAARLAKLKILSSGVPDGSVLDAFLKAESIAMELVLAENPKAQADPSMRLAKLLAASKKRIFLARGLNVRLLVQFSSFNKEQAVNMIASGWVSGTAKADAEYVYAREQYLMTQLDKGYAYLSKNELSFAGDVFYGAVRVTDDAEAHTGYMDARIRGGRGAEIEKEYADLAKAGLAPESVQLAQAWRSLQNNEVSLNDSIKTLEQVIEAEGYNPSVAWFLLGFAHHKDAMQSRHKLEFNRAAVESAHHSYMVSLDLARGNKRMLAALYSNLGLLHSVAHNYGQAASFFAQRLRLPFVSKDSHVATLWKAARLSYAGNNAPQALTYMEAALPLISESPSFSKHKKSFLEAAAFYALDAQNWEKSSQYYSQFFASAVDVSPRNQLKARMGHAWALYKLGQKSEAVIAARAVLNLSPHVPSDEKGGDILVPFRADRYAAQAYAVLANLESDNVKAVEHRSKRLAILESWQGNLDDYSLRKGDWRGFVLRELQHIASLETAAGVANPMVAWEKCIDGLKKHYSIESDSVDPAYFYVLINALVVAVDRKAPVPTSLHDKFDEMVPAYLARLSSLATGNTALVVRWWRLSLLWNAYLVQSQRMSVGQEEQARMAMLSGPLLSEVLETDPTVLASLPNRARITQTTNLK
jgi:tetratricopeptide (TPR) repeat protein